MSTEFEVLLEEAVYKRTHDLQARLSAAEAVVEAAKLEAKHQGEMSPRLRVAIRRYEEGVTSERN